MQIRNALPEDYGWILSSFISTFRQESTHAEGLKGRDITRLLTNLISNGWTCKAAEIDGLLVGWIVASTGQQMAWVFTRALVRRQGLAKLLIESCRIDMNKPVITPFSPNRNKSRCPLRLQIVHRPFLCLKSAESVNVQ